MLGRALDSTFRNFSTLFLLGALFFVPLHMVHAFVFRDELAVQELRPEIEDFPSTKKVRNVGVAELARERNTLFVLVGIDTLIAIGLFGAARRVHEIADAGDVPTVGEVLRGGAARFRAPPDVAVTAGGIVVGAAVGWHEIADAGDVPTVGEVLRGGAARFRARPDVAVTAGGIVVGAAVGWFVYRIGTLLAESLGASSMFIGIGVTRGAAVSALAAVALGCAAASARSAPRRAAKIDLY